MLEAFQSNNIEFFHENPEAKAFAYIRWNEEGYCVVVVANFSESFLNAYKVPNFPAAGTWQEWMSDCEVEAGENEIAIDLPEYAARVLVLGA